MGGQIEEVEDSFSTLQFVSGWASLDQGVRERDRVQRSAGTLRLSSQTSAKANDA